MSESSPLPFPSCLFPLSESSPLSPFLSAPIWTDLSSTLCDGRACREVSGIFSGRQSPPLSFNLSPPHPLSGYDPLFYPSLSLLFSAEARSAALTPALSLEVRAIRFRGESEKKRLREREKERERVRERVRVRRTRRKGERGREGGRERGRVTAHLSVAPSTYPPLLPHALLGLPFPFLSSVPRLPPPAELLRHPFIADSEGEGEEGGDGDSSPFL